MLRQLSDLEFAYVITARHGLSHDRDSQTFPRSPACCQCSCQIGHRHSHRTSPRWSECHRCRRMNLRWSEYHRCRRTSHFRSEYRHSHHKTRRPNGYRRCHRRNSRWSGCRRCLRMNPRWSGCRRYPRRSSRRQTRRSGRRHHDGQSRSYPNYTGQYQLHHLHEQEGKGTHVVAAAVRHDDVIVRWSRKNCCEARSVEERS